MHKTLAKMAFVALGFTFAAIVHESAFAAASDANRDVDTFAAKGDGGRAELAVEKADGGRSELVAAKGDGGVAEPSMAKNDAGMTTLSTAKADSGVAEPMVAKNDAGAL